MLCNCTFYSNLVFDVCLSCLCSWWRSMPLAGRCPCLSSGSLRLLCAILLEPHPSSLRTVITCAARSVAWLCKYADLPKEVAFSLCRSNSLPQICCDLQLFPHRMLHIPSSCGIISKCCWCSYLHCN